MPTLGQQMEAILAPRIEKIRDRVAMPLAVDIEARMQKTTRDGTSFAGQQYEPYSLGYAESYKRGARSPVTLRHNERRIENTYTRKVQSIGDNAPAVQIGFVDGQGGRIMRYHHEGASGRKGGNLPKRPIFPEKPEDIPADMLDKAKRNLTELLRGQ